MTGALLHGSPAALLYMASFSMTPTPPSPPPHLVAPALCAPCAESSRCCSEDLCLRLVLTELHIQCSCVPQEIVMLELSQAPTEHAADILSTLHKASSICLFPGNALTGTRLVDGIIVERPLRSASMPNKLSPVRLVVLSVPLERHDAGAIARDVVVQVRRHGLKGYTGTNIDPFGAKTSLANLSFTATNLPGAFFHEADFGR